MFRKFLKIETLDIIGKSPFDTSGICSSKSMDYKSTGKLNDERNCIVK